MSGAATTQTVFPQVVSDRNSRALLDVLLPLDTIDLAWRNRQPLSIATMLRDTETHEEFVRYLPLDGAEPSVYSLGINGNRTYGRPTTYEWKAPHAVVTANNQNPTLSADVIELNYQNPAQSYRPDWARAIITATADVPTVALSACQVMLGMRDGSYSVCDTASGFVSPTAMTFGAHNPRLGKVRLSARDYTCPGQVLFSGTRSTLAMYSAETNTVHEIAMPVDAPHPNATALMCRPQSHVFLLGMGSRLYIYDFLASAEPVQTIDARYALWPTACMYTENCLASWDSLCFQADHAWHYRRHCQTADLRAPTAWMDTPAWATPDTKSMLWSAPLDSAPRRL